MHLVYLNYHYDDDLRNVEDLVDRYHSSHDWCRAVREAGAKQVSIVQRFTLSGRRTIDGVEYHFVQDGLPSNLHWWQNPRLVNSYVAELKPDVVHYNGRVIPIIWLRKRLSSTSSVVWQHHGGPPPVSPKKHIHRIGFRVVDGFLFTSSEQADEWRNAGLITKGQRSESIIEASSTFEPLPRDQCRRKLNLAGDPLLLWVGRLDQNKDPLTVIKGFAHIAASFSNAHLYMIYTDTSQLNDVTQLRDKMALKDRLHLLGQVPHREMVEYYSAADYFVLGSHHEGSGFALIEALACGTTPLVTNIPPFRTITGNGLVGGLWEVGNSEAMIETFQRIYTPPTPRQTVRRYFEDRLSYERLGHEAYRFYSALHRRRQGLR